MPLDVFEASLWTDELGRTHVTDKHSALERYNKYGHPKYRERSAVIGSHGMTLFREPLRVVALVRGLDEEGDPAVYVIHEVDDGASAGRG